MQYSLSLLQQVVESKEPIYIPLALFSIASIQMTLENLEESEKALKELAAKWFKTYAEGLLSSGYDYHGNPYFDNIELEVNLEGQKIVRKKLLQSLIDDADLKVLAGISDYEMAIKELKDAVIEIEV